MLGPTVEEFFEAYLTASEAPSRDSLERLLIWQGNVESRAGSCSRSPPTRGTS